MNPLRVHAQMPRRMSEPSSKLATAKPNAGKTGALIVVMRRRIALHSQLLPGRQGDERAEAGAESLRADQRTLRVERLR